MIAVDFGATNTRAAVVRNTTGGVEIIPNDIGHSATPTYVTWDSVTGEVIVGREAKQQAVLQPKNTVFDFKQLLGRSFDSEEVQSAITQLPYTIIERDNKPFIQVEIKGESREFSPEEVTAIVLTRMKQFAEAYLGEEIEDAVVTVPASFEDAQREAMKAACAMAGLTARRVLNEPTAATMGFGINPNKQHERKVLVVHFDGGAFTATLLEIDAGVVDVLATKSHHVGDAFTQRIMDYCISQWKYDKHVDTLTDPRTLQRLHVKAERAQYALLEHTEAVVAIESSDGSAVLTQSLSHTTFETLTRDFVETVMGMVGSVLRDANVTKLEVETIVFAGGTWRLPKLRRLLVAFCGGKEPVRGVDEEEAVVHGAAILAGILSGQVEVEDGAGEMCIMPLTFLSLGMETAGGVMHRIFPRNNIYLAKKRQVVSTLHTNQTELTIRVFEGERILTRNNHFLGQLKLKGLSPAPRGVPRIEVQFEINVDYEMMVVSAQAMGSTLSENVTIRLVDNSLAYTRMKSEEYDALLEEAERAKDDDTKAKSRIERYLAIRDHALHGPSEQDDEWSDLRCELSATVDAIIAVESGSVASHDEL